MERTQIVWVAYSMTADYFANLIALLEFTRIKRKTDTKLVSLTTIEKDDEVVYNYGGNDSEGEDVNAEDENIPQITSGKRKKKIVPNEKLVWFFCEDSFAKPYTLKRHLETIHKIVNKKTLRLIHHTIYSMRREIGNAHYLCLECYELLDRKIRHQYHPS